MLIFGPGCCSKSEFMKRHPDLDSDEVDLDERTCDSKYLGELQAIVDNTHKNRKKFDYIVSRSLSVDPAQFIATVKSVVEEASSTSDVSAVITDGVHQIESANEDGTKIRHFTVKVPGHVSKWHFYFRTNGKRLYRVSISRTDYVKLAKF